MGIWSFLSEWKNAQYEKRVSEMQALNKCPDCQGKGFQAIMLQGFYYTGSFDCYGCDGSGLFSDWEKPSH